MVFGSGSGFIFGSLEEVFLGGNRPSSGEINFSGLRSAVQMSGSRDASSSIDLLDATRTWAPPAGLPPSLNVQHVSRRTRVAVQRMKRTLHTSRQFLVHLGLGLGLGLEYHVHLGLGLGLESLLVG